MTSEPAGPDGPTGLDGDGTLQVVGAPRRSLFDAVRPGELAVRGNKIRGPGGMALAALRHSGVTGGRHTGADAVVLGGRSFGTAAEGWIATAEHDALAVGYGVAAVRSRQSTPSSTWVLMRAAAFQHGAALEAAGVLAGLDPVRLCPIIIGTGAETARVGAVLSALGIGVLSGDNGDAWSMLSALDQATRRSETRAVAVVGSRDA